MFHHAGQSPNGQQRYRKFGHDQNGRYGPEFVVQRKIIDHQVRERRIVPPPRKHNHPNSAYRRRPFKRAFHVEYRKHKKQQNKSPHVHRTTHERLVAPVCIELRHHGTDLRRNLFEHLLVGFADGPRFAALKVRNEERERFAHAVTPVGNVILVKARRLVIFVQSKFGLAAGTVFSVIAHRFQVHVIASARPTGP